MRENSAIRGLLVPHYSPQNPSNDVLTEYLLGERCMPLVVYGEAGLGKSSAVALYVSHMRLGRVAHQSLSVHWCGAAGPETPHEMLQSLLPQLPVPWGERPISIETLAQDYDTLCVETRRRLANLGNSGRGPEGEKSCHVIVLDGVDDLEGNDYFWLPRRLPRGVRLILSAKETGDIQAKRRPVIKKKFDAGEKPKPGPDGRYPCKRCGRKVNPETGAKTMEWLESFITPEALEEHIDAKHKAVGSELLVDIVPMEEEVAALRLDPLGSKGLKVSLGALLKKQGLYLPPTCEARLLGCRMAKVPLFLNLAVGYLTLFECCHSIREGQGGMGDLDDDVSQDLLARVDAVVQSIVAKQLQSMIAASLKRLSETIPI